MKGSRVAVLLAALVAASPGVAGIYDPPVGSYSPEQDPKTIVRPGLGVGPVHFGDPIAKIGPKVFGPTNGSYRLRGGTVRRKNGWAGRRFSGIRVIGEGKSRRPIVAFVLTSQGYRTREGFGVGSRLSDARKLFGAPRHVRVGRRFIRVWRFRNSGSVIFVELGAGTGTGAKVIRWAIVRDRRLPASPTLRQVRTRA
jgi:hypothetical protein